MQISEASTTNTFSLFSLGFRIFFIAAGVFAVVSIAFWSAIYLFNVPLPLETISNFQWHAHEMIYGYAIAVIAGFLLAAVKNWTGVQTLHGKSLMLLFSLWLIARVLFLFGTTYLMAAAVADSLFLFFLALAIAYPIIKVKQWMQIGVLSKVILFLVFNVLFYLGALGVLNDGVYWGIYGGIYLVVGLILMMARRVVPFFIERGVGYQVTLYNSKLIDISSLILFVLFFVADVFLQNQLLSSSLAFTLFIVNAARLIGWHTKGIWKNSMLWSLYLALCFISFGFLLLAAVYFLGVSKYLAIHAFTFGGIAVITMGMMSRVALGHTGRDVTKPPASVRYALAILILGAIFRVIIPLFDSTQYSLWIGISQLLWVVAFLIFVITYLPILAKPRIDNMPG
ncbi:NnrS protein involved in response to NO [hydrothermal vent metagenome]|uniref:NnrS protein involved in response to NO n=1 Tax=hydrothermal vent metagenome TaxID=652676 RepID=A0A3B1ACZ5_9ZZZZ